MPEDPVIPEPPIALASGTTGGSTLTPPVDPPVAIPEVSLPFLRRLPGVQVTLGPAAGRVAIGALILGTLAIIADAAAGPSILVPHTAQFFPGWQAGPLHLILHWSIGNPRTVGYGFSAVLLTMIVAYLAALAAVRSLSMRLIAVTVVALHLILLLSPPMQLSDLFNYLGYARLGALHHLNPYRHVINREVFDPVYGYSSWHNLRSPYGPLFSALTYPLAFVSVPIAYWALKIVTVALSLGFVALVWQCARQLGRDPRMPVVFVALNPIFLVYEIGAFHNDFFMLVPMMGAISLALARRDRAAGAVLMLAVAVKFTAIVLLPFLLVAAAARQRRIRVLTGAAGGAVVMAALSVSLFGLSIPNLSQQSTLLTGASIPNILGLVLHLGGGTPLLLKVCAVGVVLVVAHQYFRNRDWVAGAGWATLALIASLSWLMPWYVVWLLPLAALVRSGRLRRVSIALTLYLVLSFMNWTNYYMADHGINLLSTPAGGASASLQNKLEQ
ncbi:MAG TPA: glycosyltransferase family 87 protein [Solirubrobacteraceae bacterium]|nr:glycosyltransferase family 87 protein [Solirubrobacteraceae bacterium]